MTDGMYPECGRCKKGILTPVNLGESNKKSVIYRCNNLKCNAKFDEHGYSVYNSDTLTWERITEG
jgi:hypothetical protein